MKEKKWHEVLVENGFEEYVKIFAEYGKTNVEEYPNLSEEILEKLFPNRIGHQIEFQEKFCKVLFGLFIYFTSYE